MRRLRLRLTISFAAMMTVSAALADVVSDRAAAILIWPDVVTATSDVDDFLDTIIQISNTSEQPVVVHCFYENANHHCADTGAVCAFADECCSAVGCARCEPGWIESDFRIRLTPRQPLGWQASRGMAGHEFPLTGVGGSSGPDGSTNAGSAIPPVAEPLLFNGLLKCIAINDDGTPSDRNVLKGEATRVFNPDATRISIAKHNAVGIRAIGGAVNEDRELVIGGAGAEYEGCPEHLIVNHLFDGVAGPVVAASGMVLGPLVAPLVSGGRTVGPATTSTIAGDFFGPGTVTTRLVLVPCTQDLLRQIPGQSVVQYLVYNEFEQRFSTSHSVDCKFEKVLSRIDTNDRNRSIFSAGVAGTVAGQSRLRAIGSGLVGIATEARSIIGRGICPNCLMTPMTPGAPPLFGFIDIDGSEHADFNIHQQGERDEADVITLP